MALHRLSSASEDTSPLSPKPLGKPLVMALDISLPPSYHERLDSQAQAVKSLLKTGDYADFTIICGEYTWAVHKSVVCTQCDFFKKALGEQFKEAEKNTIALPDDDPTAVYAMLQFLYTCDYTTRGQESIRLPKLPPPVFHAAVYTLADKYLIKPLGALAKSNFRGSLSGVQDDDLAQTVTELYGGDDDQHPLCSVLLEATKGRVRELFAQNSTYTEFQKAAWSLPAFSADMVQALTNLPPYGRSRPNDTSSYLISMTPPQESTSLTSKPQPRSGRPSLQSVPSGMLSPSPSKARRLRGMFRLK